MKTASKPAITVDEFLAWAEGQERGRFELFGGEIVMQQSERIAHVSVKGNVYVALRNAIAQAGLKCSALMDGATVRIEDDTAFEPDALVYCGERVPGSSLEVPNPVIVVEVLSASSAAQDMGYKRRAISACRACSTISLRTRSGAWCFITRGAMGTSNCRALCRKAR